MANAYGPYAYDAMWDDDNRPRCRTQSEEDMERDECLLHWYQAREDVIFFTMLMNRLAVASDLQCIIQEYGIIDPDGADVRLEDR